VERVGFRECEHARLVPTIGARLDVQAPYGSQTRPRLSEASGSLDSAFLLWLREGVLGVVVVYLLVRNLFALVRLLPQPRGSKELDPGPPARAGDPPPAGCAAGTHAG
jgi:hypothetical protein